MIKTIEIKGKKYLILKTVRFKTSYGYAGTNGIEVFELPHNNRLGRFSSISEFRKSIKSMSK